MTNLLSIYKKKTKDDSEKLSEVEVRKSKEIALLQKQIEDGTKQLRQQEVKMEMLRKKLDRKIEENNSLSKKLKDHIILYDNNNGNKYSKKNKKQPKSINSSNETTSNNDDTSSNNKIENNNNKNDNKDNNNSQKNFDINSSKETKNQNKETNNVLKKSKIAKINLNKIKLSSTLSFTIHEIKRRLFVVNDALDEKKNELNKLSNEEKEEKKVCSLIIESLNKEKDLLTNQLEQIQKKNNVIYKTKEVQTDEDKSNNIYHEIFDDKQKEELEDYIETLENERLQLNERLNNIISDHNREINELKKLYEQKLCHSQNKLDEEMKDSNDESLHEKEIIKLLKKNNQEYMNKISQLEQNNKFFKEKQKDLKKKLREFANENNHLIERPIKASRKSLRSSNSESTIVPSEGEMTVNTSISDLTNCDKDSHHQMNSSSQFSLPVICIKDTDNNSIVKAKDINICSKNDGSSCMSSDNNINITNSKNPLEKQNNSILNTNDFLPSILNKK
ncbi:hypothetical protein H8356DRAFT_950553 [Neocallimastix lanati (nom. inval.)]|uniref:Uncharacterized protein n=1 Tax=Neocallimastix californiae TaxID=1754190 RepID=A0A1Y2B3Q2_9FUNG|nr:hypothetical protein H8356DRAFT_950553 [Neocallimastix sp. JGI-2020a]ORY29190.1 hypothetical protein LY90DRAFT_512915 [Neocallimastix californiae]|eukprot:ORY29190.1 hypothetical protein LY90DRAFT_512915 [Neocallimastix californiae]